MIAPEREKLEGAIYRLIEYNEGLREGRYDLNECEVNLKGGVMVVDRCGERGVIIVGDIHGDLPSLKYIKERFLRQARKRFLTVFLGDYIDRGLFEWQAATIVELAEVSRELEGAVVFLRGNHEPPKGMEPVPHDYPEALKSIYGAEWGERLYEASRRFFDSLLHALVYKGSFLAVHGGPPTSGFESDLFDYLDWRGDGERFIEILWNDPYEGEGEKLPSPRGIGFLWGRPVTRRALDKVGARVIVRAHEPVMEGSKFNHGKKVLTLFSRKGEPYGNPLAAVAVCQSASQLALYPETCIKRF
ncbi:MAG: serine/threonine protein phosphatase [Desulfurococcales archaeon]|nr:serine/threonine protein phosphatase [Desulfurococcales archaeon]